MFNLTNLLRNTNDSRNFKKYCKHGMLTTIKVYAAVTIYINKPPKIKRGRGWMNPPIVDPPLSCHAAETLNCDRVKRFERHP